MDSGIFVALKEESKIRRALNRESSAKVLRSNGFPFESKNDGAHLIVGFGIADFWPGTGKWTIRKTGESGRGVFPLMRKLRE